MSNRLFQVVCVAGLVLGPLGCTRSEPETPRSPPPPYDPTRKPCINRDVVEHWLGLVSFEVASAPTQLRPRALLRGVRATSAFVATDRGFALGGFTEVVDISMNGSWRRVALGPEDIVRSLKSADIDHDGDADVVAFVDRMITMRDPEGDTSSPYPFELVLERKGHDLSLRSARKLKSDANWPKADSEAERAAHEQLNALIPAVERTAQLVVTETPGPAPTAYAVLDLACHAPCTADCRLCLFERCTDPRTE